PQAVAGVALRPLPSRAVMLRRLFGAASLRSNNRCSLDRPPQCDGTAPPRSARTIGARSTGRRTAAARRRLAPLEQSVLARPAAALRRNGAASLRTAAAPIRCESLLGCEMRRFPTFSAPKTRSAPKRSGGPAAAIPAHWDDALRFRPAQQLG